MKKLTVPTIEELLVAAKLPSTPGMIIGRTFSFSASDDTGGAIIWGKIEGVVLVYDDEGKDLILLTSVNTGDETLSLGKYEEGTWLVKMTGEDSIEEIEEIRGHLELF